MTTRYLAAAIAAAVLAVTASAQSGADLLQKGIYAQETLGDLDGAIRIYRQVTASPTVPKQLAAQAQYQLVLCMLQKGDRTGASHELDLLTRNFPEQQEFIDKARKLVPGAATLLAPPWTDGEASQLNIKRDGQFTGEYLYYSATPWLKTVEDMTRSSTDPGITGRAQDIYLSWKLKTNTSTRIVSALVDRSTMNHKQPTRFSSDDVLGDASAAPFAGPAIDADMLIYHLRLLPLAVGYKTTVTVWPFLLGHGVPKPVELAVTGVEEVRTVAGKFNCYKVSFASLGQTFWIGVDGARPLVKFQSGKVEAELVKLWGPSVFDDALTFLTKAGWYVKDVRATNAWEDMEDGVAYAMPPVGGPYGTGGPHGSQSVNITLRRTYTPPQELEHVLQVQCPGSGTNIQTRTVGGHPSISCVGGGGLSIHVATESLLVGFTPTGSASVFRWIFEPVLDTFELH